MIRTCHITLLILLTMNSVSHVHAQSSNVDARRAHLRHALEDEWEWQLRSRPELATAIGDTRYNDRLDDYSAAAEARFLAHAKEEISVFESISTDGFPEQEALNKSLMLRGLREDVEAYRFKDWEMPVNQMNGPHLELASLTSQMPFTNVRDYENYLARLHQIPHALDQLMANMRQGMQDHLMPPKYLLEKVAIETQDIATKPLEDSPFAAPVKKFPSSIPTEEQQRLKLEILAVVKDEIQPVYAKFSTFVRVDYAPHGRTEYGIWALPYGASRYRFDVKEETTTDMTPDEIHDLGLKEVAQIDAQMLALARSLGYQDIASSNAHIQHDPKLYGKSGQQILDLYQHYVDQMYAKLPQLFGHLPAPKLEVVPMEAYRAPNAVPADYSPGSAHGERPGRINVNEYDPTRRLLLNVEAIAYHEGIPGHHIQFSIAQSLPNLPPFRRFAGYDAYSEGWAFYAERLGKEVNLYQDPYSEYGRLENEMWRAVRLVVDTGVHEKHWSRQQMIDFFHAHTAMDDQNIETEVDRYIAWPGQALAYKVGQMEILKLRARAREVLGTKFDIRSFHDAILAEGPLPLDVLDTRIQAWIDEQQKQTTKAR
jgi:uncharacterized protein (DUF885 family)